MGRGIRELSDLMVIFLYLDRYVGHIYKCIHQNSQTHTLFISGYVNFIPKDKLC